MDFGTNFDWQQLPPSFQTTGFVASLNPYPIASLAGTKFALQLSPAAGTTLAFTWGTARSLYSVTADQNILIPASGSVAMAMTFTVPPSAFSWTPMSVAAVLRPAAADAVTDVPVPAAPAASEGCALFSAPEVGLGQA